MANAAASSSCYHLSLTPLCNSTTPPRSRQLTTLSFAFNPQVSKSAQTSITTMRSFSLMPKIRAISDVVEAVETLEPNVEGLDDSGTLPLAADSDVEKMAPKQKIRIKLRSYWVSLIEDSCKQIMDTARNTNAKTMGPVPLPTKRRIYCVLKSPHVHKDARFHFEIRTHQRLIDILHPTAQTIDSLMQLDLPAGVDVEVKL
ncbi:30S ribosomal protein S10-like [Zostera marina]|uniref:Small ribosomal subunit protein uS10c n=1 Tax=Zostera marina TaxID=29655 RepID=A0A0K9PMV9_ZOSMR|nr:30S ribosomal protein S10-like [Zostera marina]